jgi:hypothetical protein
MWDDRTGLKFQPSNQHLFSHRASEVDTLTHPPASQGQPRPSALSTFWAKVMTCHKSLDDVSQLAKYSLLKRISPSAQGPGRGTVKPVQSGEVHYL